MSEMDQLRHNFERLAKEKAAMEGYCEEMHRTVESKVRSIS